MLLSEMIKKSKYDISIEKMEENGAIINYQDLPSIFRIKLMGWLETLEDYDYKVGPQFEEVNFINLIS